MKATAVVYVDTRGVEHDALVRAVNGMHPGYIDLAYVDAEAPENDNVKTLFSVPHMDDESKKEPNPALPQIHLHVWKEHYRVHGEPAPDHPIFDSPYEEKQKDEFGKVIEKERPQYEAQIAAHQASAEGLPTGADLDAVVETKHYSDGSSATGVAPLPPLSPAEQEDLEKFVHAHYEAFQAKSNECNSLNQRILELEAELAQTTEGRDKELQSLADEHAKTPVLEPPPAAPEQQKAQEEEAQKEAEYGQPSDSEKDYPKRADGSLDR